MKSIMNKLTLFLGAWILLTSCLGTTETPLTENEAEIQNYLKTSSLSYQKSPEGMYYSINSAGSSKGAEIGSLIKFYYTISDLKGNVFYDLKETSGKFNSQVFGGVANSIFTLPLSIMKEGDIASFILPSNLAFGGSSIGGIEPYSVIKIDLKVIEISTSAEQLAQMKIDFGFVDTLLKETSTGLVYQTINPSTGTEVKTFNQVAIKYVGKLGYKFYQDDGNGGTLYDSTFDSSDSVMFALNSGQLIAGFEEAIKLMKVKEKAKFIIPYNQGYGTTGSAPTIPGYAHLFFEVEVLTGN